VTNELHPHFVIGQHKQQEKQTTASPDQFLQMHISEQNIARCKQ
jgi:hypothetical protein